MEEGRGGCMGLFCCANKIKKATITKPNQPNHKRVSFPCSCNSNPTLQPFPSRPSSLSRVLCVVCGCDSALQTVDGWQCVVQIWSGKHRNAKTPILLHTPKLLPTLSRFLLYYPPLTPSPGACSLHTLYIHTGAGLLPAPLHALHTEREEALAAYEMQTKKGKNNNILVR